MASGLVLHVAELIFVLGLAPVALLLRLGEAPPRAPQPTT
jgi:hypothetical protein